MITINGKKYDGNIIKIAKKIISISSGVEINIESLPEKKIIIEGDVKGKVDGTNIDIKGNVDGNVDGTNTTICGDVSGDVDGTNITIGGSVGGDVDGTVVKHS